MSAADQRKISGMIGRGGLGGTKTSTVEKMVKMAAEAVEEELQWVALGKIYTSYSAFTDYHRKRVYASISVDQNMGRVLQIPNAKALKDLQFHMRMGEQAAAERIIKTYTAAQELKQKGPAIVKKLMRQNNP